VSVGTVTAKPFWDKDPDVAEDRGKFMVQSAKVLEKRPEESLRADLNLVHARMYENSPVPTLYQFGGGATQAASFAAFDVRNRSTWNVMRNAADTARSQVVRNRPRARFLTSGGTYKQKRKARGLTKFCDGLFSEARVYEKTSDIFRDCEVFDAGAIQVLIDDDRVTVQRALSCEFLVDQTEAMHGAPMTLYRRRPTPRGRVLAKWGGAVDSPKYKAIQDATSVDPLGTGGNPDSIVLYEAWHLRGSKKLDDGWHVIAIDTPSGGTSTLFEEKWPKDYFPVLFLRWASSVIGFWGRSFCEQVAPLQYEIDKMLIRIERSLRLMTTPRIGIERGSKILKSQLTNAEASVVEFTRNPPVALTWPALPAEYYKHLDENVQKVYDLAGISRQAAAGMKEAGVTSAVAIRESLDIQQTNLAVIQKLWEQFHVDIARVMVDLAADLYGRKGTYKVKAPTKGKGSFLDTIDWKDVNIPSDDYTIEVYPTSLLPTTPAGRLETVQEMVKSGLWSPERGAAALDDLDVESAENMTQAAERLIEKQFEEMLYDGIPHHPDEFTPPDLALKTGAQYITIGLLEEVPEKHIDLARRYLDDLADLTAPPEPPAASAPSGDTSPLPPAGLPPPGAPPMLPGPPVPGFAPPIGMLSPIPGAPMPG